MRNPKKGPNWLVPTQSITKQLGQLKRKGYFTSLRSLILQNQIISRKTNRHIHDIIVIEGTKCIKEGQNRRLPIWTVVCQFRGFRHRTSSKANSAINALPRNPRDYKTIRILHHFNRIFRANCHTKRATTAIITGKNLSDRSIRDQSSIPP